VKSCAFGATGAYRRQHTDLVEFVTPAAASLWNMRWQVRGYLLESPDASEAELFGRFAEGSGLRAGNLRAVFGHDSWAEQLDRFGEVLLLTSFALYEGWIHELLSSFPLSARESRDASNWMSSAQCAPPVATRAWSVLTRDPSPFAARQFRPALRKDRHAAGLTAVPHLLQAMRGFKALRNALVHRSGLANASDVASVAAARTVIASDIRSKSAAEIPLPLVGHRVAVPYRSAVSCSAILLKLVMTLDAELAGTKACEMDIRARLRLHPSADAWRELPGNPTARAARIRGWLNGSGVPPSSHPLEVANWMKAHGLVWY
jgi:hypothetical protein